MEPKGPKEFVWKRDCGNWIISSTKDVEVIKDKLLKAIDIYDDPEDYEDAIKKINGKTDLGIAFMEIHREYVNKQLEEEISEEEI